MENRTLLAHQTVKMFEGPVPHPDVLAGYQKIDPNFATAIVSMAQKQQEQRHQIEKQQMEVERHYVLRGQLFGFITLIFFGAIGALLLSLDKSLAGFGTLVGAAASAATSLYLKYKQIKKS